MPAIEFPKMMHHPDKGQKTVRSQQEQDELGSDWLESHAEAQKLKEEQDAAKAEAAEKRKK